MKSNSNSKKLAKGVVFLRISIIVLLLTWLSNYGLIKYAIASEQVAAYVSLTIAVVGFVFAYFMGKKYDSLV